MAELCHAPNAALQHTAPPCLAPIRPLPATARDLTQQLCTQLVDMGPNGPLRCSGCGAYMNPYMQFSNDGAAFTCNFCRARCAARCTAWHKEVLALSPARRQTG